MKFSISKFLIFKIEVVSVQFLFSVFYGIAFVNAGTEVGRISSECDVQLFQETIHAGNQGLKIEKGIKIRDMK